MDKENQNNNNEVDILVLLNYFKNGFLGIFRSISNLFGYISNKFIDLILIIKKNFILLIVSTIIFGIIGYFRQNILPIYYYEMIVTPNYNSTYDLYNFIDAGKLKNISSKYNFNKITIEPVKSLKDEVELFYKMTEEAPEEQDTIFYKEYKIKEFIKELEPHDYTKQKISINSPKYFNPLELQNYIILSIEKNPNFVTQKEIIINDFNQQETRYIKGLKRIDSLLIQIKQQNISSTNIKLDNEGKTNVEKDLIDGYKTYINKISNVNLKREKISSIIKIISPMKQVYPKGLTQGGVINSAILGFLLGLCFIIIFRFIKNIEKYKRKF